MKLGPKGHLHFGKHRGLHWTKVPADYLEWAKEGVQGFAKELEELRAQELPLFDSKPPQRPGVGRKWQWPNPPKHFNDRTEPPSL